MATTYGLTLAGLVIKAFTQIRSEADAAVRAALGNSIPLGDRTLLGEYNAIWADREASIWQLLEVIYSASDPDKATGAALDALCLLTGTLRPGAAKSAVTLTLGGSPATTIPAGSQVRTGSTGVVFATTDPVTLTLVSSWVSATAYVVDNVVTRSVSGVSTLFQCILATSGTTPPESDSTHWVQIGTGTAWGTVDALSVDTGAVEATAGDLSVIVTAVGGWQTAYNQTNASLGRDVATDEELRLLREAELAAPGTAPVEAIRADILQITGVTTCTVFDNPGDTTNADGMPPHSVEVLVQGGDDTTIAGQLFNSVAAGIATTGNQPPIVVTDSQHIDHSIRFSRPVEVPIYTVVALIVDAKTYPLDGDVQVAEAIIERGNAGGAGKDAVATSVIAACFSVPGVLDVTTAHIGTAPSPGTGATIVIDSRHLATWAILNTTVTSVPGTP